MNQALEKLFTPLKKSAYQPVGRKVNEVSINELQYSRYFGPVFMLENTTFPTIEGRPGIMVLQLNLETIPESMQQYLGNSGIMQIFTEDNIQDYNPEEQLVVRYIDADAQGQFVPQTHMTYTIDSIVVIDSWKKVEDYPHSESFDEELEQKIQEQDVNYDDYPDCWQGDKMGGHPFWYQSDETPVDSHQQEMQVVYQFDMGCFFDGMSGEAYAQALAAAEGTVHVFVSKTDRNEVALTWAC